KKPKELSAKAPKFPRNLPKNSSKMFNNNSKGSSLMFWSLSLIELYRTTREQLQNVEEIYFKSI
ncbi:11910_t:CDS:1, partial [Gigaspora margarita]